MNWSPPPSDPAEIRGTGSVAALRGHPLHPMVVPIVIGLYVGAAGADLGYASTGDAFWGRSASWLLLATIGAAMVAAVPGIIDLMALPRARNVKAAWAHATGNALFLVVVAFNYAARQPDPGVAKDHFGLFLTLLGLALLGASGWLGGELTYRYGIGVAPHLSRSDASFDTADTPRVRDSLAEKFWRRPQRPSHR